VRVGVYFVAHVHGYKDLAGLVFFIWCLPKQLFDLIAMILILYANYHYAPPLAPDLQTMSDYNDYRRTV